MRLMLRSGWHASFVAIGLAGSAMAQAGQNPAETGPNPFETGAQAGQPQRKAAPAWARAGTRITYFNGSATVANARTKFVPGGNGRWTNAAGQSMKPEDVGSGSGGGFTVLAVGHDDGQTTSLTIANYLLTDPMQGFVTVAPKQPSGGAAAHFTNSEFWQDPAGLARMQEGQSNGVTVARCEYPMDGKVYHALRYNVETDSGGQMNTWDLDTGLLLFSSTISVSMAPMMNPNGGGSFSAAQTNMVIVKLVGLRDVPIPWANEPAPPWTQQVRHMEYAGTYRNVMPGAMNVAVPFGYAYEMTGHGPQHVTFNVAMQGGAGGVDAMGQPLGPTPEACGSATPLGIFLPTAAIGRLQAGQVIDRDPILKTQIVCSRSDARGVTLSEIGALFRSDITYDANGMMVATRLAQSAAPATTIIESQLRAAN